MGKNKNRKVFDFGSLPSGLLSGMALGGTRTFTEALTRFPAEAVPKTERPEPVALEAAAMAVLEAWEAWLGYGPSGIHLATMIAGPGKVMAEVMETLKVSVAETIKKEVTR